MGEFCSFNKLTVEGCPEPYRSVISDKTKRKSDESPLFFNFLNVDEK